MKTDSGTVHSTFHPDYSEEMEYFEKCKVYSVQIESNLKCHQGCLFCYASSDYDVDKELPRNSIISIIDSAVEMEVRAIDWLGGDPLLRKDWYELMIYANEKGLTNNIWTSGLPLADPDVARKAVEVTDGGFISVHLDTLNEDLYRKLHTGNARNKIEKILKGVDNVLNLGKRPENMVNCITFNNLLAGEDVKRTIEFFYNKKGIATCLTQMCDAGLAKEHPDWMPTLDNVKAACEARDNSNYPDSSVSICSMDTSKFYCGGIICVTVDGDVTPCSVIREGTGNIHEQPLIEIVEEHKNTLLQIQLRKDDNLPGSCKSCDNNAVCWGCRANAYYEKGDILAEDPNCWKFKED
jgi:radical SAM protein with 4Fe4S-binding SPASM domain